MAWNSVSSYSGTRLAASNTHVYLATPSQTPSYYGCIEDSAATRDFYMQQESSLMTRELCAETGFYRGFKYIGLQYGDRCWLDASPPDGVLRPDSDCST